MSYAYIVDMISSYDMKNIPNDVVAILKRKDRRYTIEETKKIVLSGDNYCLMTKLDLLSFSKENPDVLSLSQKDYNNDNEDKIYFELFCERLSSNSDDDYFFKFLDFAKNTEEWLKIINTKGVMDSLFKTGNWEQIKTYLVPEDLEILKQNSNGEAFRSYILNTKSQFYYPYSTAKKTSQLLNYKDMRQTFFNDDNIETIQSRIAFLLTEFVQKTAQNRTLSCSFFEDILKTEQDFAFKQSKPLYSEFEKSINYALICGKMLFPVYNNIVKGNFAGYQTDLLSSQKYVEEYIKENGLSMVLQILSEKEADTYFNQVPGFIKTWRDFALQTHVNFEKEILLSATKKDEEDSIKKKNRL